MNFIELTVDQVRQMYCYQELEYYLEDDDVLANLELLAGKDLEIHDFRGTLISAFSWIDAEFRMGLNHNYWGLVYNRLIDAHHNPKIPPFKPEN